MSQVFPINADPRFRIYTADAGQTAFPVPFPWQDNADIKILRTDLENVTTTLNEAEHYQLTGAGETAGGTMTLNEGEEALEGETFLILGDASLVRVSSIVQGGRFRYQGTDNDLDRFTIIAQEIDRELGRALRTRYGAPGAEVEIGADNTLPRWLNGRLVPGPVWGDGIGIPGPGVPAGGLPGQLLSKASGTDYDGAWVDPPNPIEDGDKGDIEVSSDATVWTIGANVLSSFWRSVINTASASLSWVQLLVLGHLATFAALQALAPAAGMAVFVSEQGKSGTFVWRVGNFSALVALDPLGAIYRPWSSGDPTGAAGCWVRAFTDDPSPHWWGAKGDCITIANAVTTNGSTQVTSVSAPFTAADVGKTIALVRGGAGGVTLVTTIAAFTNASTIQLATNALNSATNNATFGSLDTTALQAAIDFCAATGTVLSFPAAQFFSGALTTSGVVAWRGAGQGTSQIIFTGNAGFTYTGGNNPRQTPAHSVYMKGIGFVTAAPANAATAVLNFSYSAQWTGIRSVELESVRVQGLTDANSFGMGMRLYNCSQLILDKPEVINGTGIATNSVGIRVDGDEQPVDMYISLPQVRFCDIGIDVNGTGTGAGFEGLGIEGGAVLFCNTPVKLNSLVGHPYVKVAGVNLNGFAFGIVASNVTNLHVVDNLFYTAVASSPPAFFTAVQINNGDAGMTIRSGNIIADNIFYALNTPTPGPPQSIGVSIASTNGADTHTLVDGNQFVGFTYGVILFAGANNVAVNDSNSYAGCTTDVSYQATTGSASVFRKSALGNGEQMVVAEQISVLASDFAGQNVNTAQPVFSVGQDVLTVKALTTYEFEAEYEIDTSGTTSHSLSTLFALGGGASLTSIAYTAEATNSANASAPSATTLTRAAAATAVAITAAVAAATQNSVRLRGVMRVNAGGTITPQFQYSAAPGAAPTIKANSFFRLWPIGSNTVAAVGPWA